MHKIRLGKWDPKSIKPHRKILFVGRSGGGKSVAMRPSPPSGDAGAIKVVKLLYRTLGIPSAWRRHHQSLGGSFTCRHVVTALG